MKNQSIKNYTQHLCLILLLVQNDFGPTKSFWSGTNGLWTNFHNLDLPKMIWTQTKQIGPDENDWYSTKIIWTVQNHLGPIEGQGIKRL